jgi:hypothetical protein
MRSVIVSVGVTGHCLDDNTPGAARGSRLYALTKMADALRCRRDYHKREKNVKKILLDLFADLAVFESGA